MTITTEEVSIQQNDSVELYEITIGASVFYLTSYYKDYDLGEQTFYAIAGLRRSGFQVSADNTPSECKVTIPSTYAALVDLIRDPEALCGVSIVIKRHFIDPDLTEIIFFGDASSGFSFSNGLCDMTFKDLLYVLDREICRVRMQSLCNNRLGDYTCGVDKESATFKLSSVAVIVDSTRKILSSADFDAKDDGFFTNGIVVLNGIKRVITKHVGTDVYIVFPIAGLSAGAGTIDSVYAGCDKTPETCRDRFNKLENFVGMPYIPTKDPRIIPITNAA